MSRPKRRILSVEGEIGAGKTELTSVLAAELAARDKNVCLIQEPVEQWREVGILDKFYADPERYAYTFQTYAFASRILSIADKVRANPSADVYILERTPATDMVFMAAQGAATSPMEREMYLTWCSAFSLMLPLDLRSAQVVYLRPSIAACMERIAERRRGEEIRESDTTGSADGAPTKGSGVTVSYQETLRRAHEAFFLGLHAGDFPLLPECPFARENVFTVDPALADRDFRAGKAARQPVVEHIIDTLGLLKSD